MINLTDFVLCVIRPTLSLLDLGGVPAEKLLLATALAESSLGRLRQEKGPAIGVYQMEPATYWDCWDSYLDFHPDLAAKVKGLVTSAPPVPTQMQGNLYFATAMCRVKYLRVPEPIPSGRDLREVAAYWKRWYNTFSGAGTPEHFISAASSITDPSLNIWT